MPILSTPQDAFGAAANPGLFGGNILAPIGEMTGPGSYAEALDALGVTTMRYPGGSLTEELFDLSNPDSLRVTDVRTGQTQDFIPLSDFMEYAAESGRPVNIVLPTRDSLSNRTDANGDRLPDIDEAELTGFVRDVVSGVYGDGRVVSFEIGNEYWGSGEMSAAEYGRLAAEMTQIIDAELNALAASVPQALEVDILVQMGTNFNYSDLEEDYTGLSNAEIITDLNEAYGLSLTGDVVNPSGRIDWTEVNNEIVIAQFEEAGALDEVDAVVAHLYSRAPDVAQSRYFPLEQIEDTWLEADPNLAIHVTEWNQKANTGVYDEDTDYGLFQAQEMLEIVEEFMRMDVEAAQVWPLIQFTPSTLSQGPTFTGQTVPGEMFEMLSENLPGMRMLDFSPGPGRDGEFETPQMDVHAFADGEDLLLYVTSNLQSGVVQNELDISGLVAGFDGMEVTTLGVAAGDRPGDPDARAVVERLSQEDVYEDGLIDTILGPGEIMQVRLTGVQPTDGFADVFASTAGFRDTPSGPVVDEEDTGEDDVDAEPTAPGRGDFVRPVQREYRVYGNEEEDEPEPEPEPDPAPRPQPATPVTGGPAVPAHRESWFFERGEDDEQDPDPATPVIGGFARPVPREYREYSGQELMEALTSAASPQGPVPGDGFDDMEDDAPEEEDEADDGGMGFGLAALGLLPLLALFG